MKFQLKRYQGDNPQPILVPRKEIPWESKAVFNPSVVYDQGIYRMLYRTYPDIFDTTTPRGHRPGFRFKNQISYIGYAESKDGILFTQRDAAFISPSEGYDKYGCEDPRITKIGDTFYITYTAIDTLIEKKDPNIKIRIALATTKDFVTVEKHGIIGPPHRSKAAAFFPEKVYGGKIALAMTINSDSTNSQVAIRYYDSMNDVKGQTDESWADFLKETTAVAPLGTLWWLDRGPELGAAPIKTNKGWLLIFSNEAMTDTWSIGAALLDLDDPQKLIARTSGNILQPVTDYEREGLVPNVTFPEGAVVVGEDLYVYYGAADTVIGLATCKLDDLLDYILSFKIQN